MKTTSKNFPPLQNFLPPLLLKRILLDIFFMTSHLDSHGTTYIKPDMLSGVQTGNGIQHVDIIYVVLGMCTQTEKTPFVCKDDYC